MRASSEEPAPNHWMYRLPSISLESVGLPAAWYEFLIEYDVTEPHVGIYYGVKCVCQPESDFKNAIAIASEHWERL